MQESAQSDFELTLARPVVQTGGEHPALVHLWWRGGVAAGHVVQVYVDDELYDVAEGVGPRELWLVLDRSAAHRIELLAVPVSEAWRARSVRPGSWQPRVRDAARLAVLRDARLPVDTCLRVSVDGVVVDAGALWPRDVHRAGFGALFGEGGFGFDAVTGPGLGRGELGYGVLGADGTAWRWEKGGLEAGERVIAVEGRDAKGEVVADAVTRAVSMDSLARPVRDPAVDQDFRLRWR